MNYIITNNIGNTINDSWEVDTDIFSGPLEEQAFDQLLETAAAKGISFQFSSGDGGDEGLGTPIGAPGVPSNSPHATAVGGTSILNNLNGSGYETLGWGGSFVVLNNQGVLDPPLQQPFLVGAEEERAFTSPNPPGKRVFLGLAGRFPISLRWPIPILAFPSY